MPYFYLGGIRLNTFTLVIIIAFFSCIMVFVLSPKYSIRYYKSIVTSLLFAMVFAVIIGKVFYAIGSSAVDERPFLERVIYGGCVFYGGLIGGVAGIALYGKLFHEKILDIMDVFASLIPLGQAIGRIGCFLNGCCYGVPYNGIFSIRINIDGTERSVFPVWFVESFICLALFIVFQKTRNKKSGYYVVRYVVVYGIARFFIEYIRGDLIRGLWGLFSTSQIISIFLVLAGILLWLKTKTMNRKNEIFAGGKLNEDI